MRGRFFWAQDPFRITIIMQRHYAVYHSNPTLAGTVVQQLQDNSIPFEIHLQRTRFWLDTAHPLHSYIALVCKDVTDETDHALGV